MPYILQCDFPYEGPWGAQMTAAMELLAESINHEPGVVWKIWTVNERAQEAGGIYLFDSYENAEKYLNMHKKRLMEAGIRVVNGKIFEVQGSLSKINKAPC